MSPAHEYRWIVDGIEEEVARLEVDGASVTVPRWLLPADAREGDVLRVRHDRGAARSALEVERDEGAAREARARSAEQVRERGTASDPGGDITL